MKLLVTGGAGFIGSNFVQHWIQNVGSIVVNLDKLTYAGNSSNLKSLRSEARHSFVQGDINDASLVRSTLAKHKGWLKLVHAYTGTGLSRATEDPSRADRDRVRDCLPDVGYF